MVFSVVVSRRTIGNIPIGRISLVYNFIHDKLLLKLIKFIEILSKN